MKQQEIPTISKAIKKFTSKENTQQAIQELIDYHVLQAKIEENESILQMLKIHGNDRNRLPVIIRLGELQEQLEKLTYGMEKI